MNDMLTAMLLVSHFAGRKPPEPKQAAEPVREGESRWARVLAWHRKR